MPCRIGRRRIGLLQHCLGFSALTLRALLGDGLDQLDLRPLALTGCVEAINPWRRYNKKRRQISPNAPSARKRAALAAVDSDKLPYYVR